MRELNTSDIAQQELEVQNLTHNKLNGFCNYFNRAIDLLIKLYYRIPKIQDVNTLEGAYLCQASYWFYMPIFTFRACYILIEGGYYYEAHILCRNLIEVFVKMRYFEKHKDELQTFDQPHKGKRPSILLKTMFDEVLPGYYDTQYRSILAHIAHGGVGALLFKVDVKSPTETFADTGVVFHEKYASLVMNNISNFIFGYIRFYKYLYPEVIKTLDVRMLQEIVDVEKILEAGFEEHVVLKGGENDWHKVSRQIWNF